MYQRPFPFCFHIESKTVNSQQSLLLPCSVPGNMSCVAMCYSSSYPFFPIDLCYHIQYYSTVSKIEKLLSRAKSSPQHVRFDEICKLAEYFGFHLKGGKGSHRVYSKKGVSEILTFQNIDGMAKPYQVRQLLDIIERYKLEER